MTTHDDDFLASIPLLNVSYTFLPIERFRYAVWNAVRKATLRIKGTADFLPELLPLMDGRRSAGDIARELSAYDADDVVGVIAYLVRQEFATIVEPDPGEDIPEADLRRHGPWIDYLRHFHNNPEKYFLLMRKTRLGLYFNGLAGYTAAVSLARMGARRFLLLDTGEVTADEVRMTPLLRESDLGISRMGALRRILQDYSPDISVELLPPGEGEEFFAPLADRADFLLLCDEDQRRLFPRLLNGVAVERRVPFISTTVDGFAGNVGPSVIPGQTACIVCAESRRKANEDAGEIQKAMEDFRAHLTAESFAPRPDASLLAMLGEMTASEASRIISGFTYPLTLGKFLRVNIQEGSVTPHQILKLPRCPVCGPARNAPEYALGFPKVQ